MVKALSDLGFNVVGTDIAKGEDFLMMPGPVLTDAIITNPPYNVAERFFRERAVDLMFASKGIVAMLLRTDFDHAKTRRQLFGHCAQFAKKVVLTKRIKWFAGFVWLTVIQPCLVYLELEKYSGPPTLAYGPCSHA